MRAACPAVSRSSSATSAAAAISASMCLTRSWSRSVTPDRAAFTTERATRKPESAETVNVRRSSDGRLTALSASGLDVTAEVVLPLAHGLATLGDGGAQVGAELPQRAGQVGRDPIGRVALDRAPHEAHQPERHAEAEAGADHQPEQPLEHRRGPLPLAA